MIKKLLMVFIALFSMQFYAQQGTASPYSYYGIGSLKFKGTVENRSMGGLSIFADSIHINLRNPASYGGYNLDTPEYAKESRPVSFNIGGNHSRTNLKSDFADGKNTSTSLDYLTISIPVGKLGIGFGLMPYSAVGYKLQNFNDDGDIQNKFTGEGGINKVFFSMGYQLSKSFSLGVDGHYNFGNIENTNVGYLYSNGDLLQYQTRKNNRSDLNGFSMNLGVLYRTNISEKLQLSSGITYTPQSKLRSKNEQSLSTIIISTTTGVETVINTVEDDLGSLKETELTIPSKFSLGAGVGHPRKWFAGMEYTAIQSSNFYNELYASDGKVYDNGYVFSVGGFYIPDYNAFSGYWKRIVYRAGLRFEDTGLMVNNNNIKDFGISFGLGLPMGNTLSSANIGFEFGKRGTTQDNLVQENYFNLMISLSLTDRWFKKKKYY